MTNAIVPHELLEIQQRFTRMLRTPLSTRTGTFTPELSTCDPELVAHVVDDAPADALTRLGVYQRQYWLRLFTAMQTELPLSARLIGLYRFNQLAQEYLQAHPPVHVDLGRIADSFQSWIEHTPAARAQLQQRGVTLPKAALMQAIELDRTWQRVWMTPSTAPWKPSNAEAERLSHAQLIATPRLALFDEDWPLVSLRQAMQHDASNEHIALPKRLSSPRHWALVRTEHGIGQLRLQPKQAMLYRACASHPLNVAVARLEAASSRQHRAELPAQVQHWFALSMELGFWSGIQPE